MYEDFAYTGSKTRRKDYRRRIRNILGTSSDDAPTILHALDAARELGALVDVASGGRFGIAVYDMRTKQHRPVHEVKAEIKADEERRYGDGPQALKSLLRF